jgi:uncharacterized protein (TIGR02145 family)
MLNQQIQNYKIISLLGEGGMANVYLVEHLTLGQNFALKLLKDEFVQHPNIRKRFLAEARNLAKMQHSNVIKVTDLIDAGDIVAFVMEYIEGVSLEDYISTRSPLSHETIEKLFLQMIDAVEYVHSQGLIHRDIKPSNFMATPDDSVKLLDFGIAKNLNDGAVDYTKTSMAQQMGTPMYMSPEQVRNTAEITPQTDIYSLGVVLWQMVTNKKPYDSERLTLPEIQVAIMKEPLPLTNTGWDDVIEFATSKATYDRCSDFDELKELISFVEIDEFLSRQEATALAEVVYEKGFKEIDKIVDEVAQNRKQREKKMQALSPASTSKINQKYLWIGISFLSLIILLFLLYYNFFANKQKEQVITVKKDIPAEVKNIDTTPLMIEKPIEKKDILIKTEVSDIKIGNQIWKTKNYSETMFRDGTKLFQAKSSSDWIYAAKNKIPAYVTVKVRGENQILYNAYAVHNSKEIAPVGYHVPSVQEWTRLIEYCGGEDVAGDNLTGKKYRGKDKYGFNAIPAGSFHVYHQIYNGVEEVSGGNRDYQGSSLWWTSETRVHDFDNSIKPYFVSSKDGFIWWGTHNYGYGCSIRLIKD